MGEFILVIALFAASILVISLLTKWGFGTCKFRNPNRFGDE